MMQIHLKIVLAHSMWNPARPTLQGPPCKAHPARPNLQGPTCSYVGPLYKTMMFSPEGIETNYNPKNPTTCFVLKSSVEFQQKYN